jgi:hypothetical protein
MIDQFLHSIDQVQADGGVVLLKWDGVRAEKRCTVVISKAELNYVWHQDSDDMADLLARALEDYKATQGL